MRTPVIAVGPQWSLLKAKSLFERNEISGAPVVEDGKVVGVFSLGDVLRHMSSEAPPTPSGGGSTGADTCVGDLMSSPAICVRPEDSLPRVMERMLSRRIRRIMVVDAEESLVGIITAQVLLEAYLRALRQQG